MNHQFETVFYKNNFSFRVGIMNLYMVCVASYYLSRLSNQCLQIFGGTNWGNLGHPGGYTSYDYGAAITESRNLTREKYGELKLLANFAKVSPSYLVTNPGNQSTVIYTNNPALSVTPLLGRNKTDSSFFVMRHTDYSSESADNYKLMVPTSAGTLTIPQLGGNLTLNGRDSKIHVVDYPVAGTNILYSTAEVFTWKQFSSNKVLVLYGGPGEHHEFAVSGPGSMSVVEGSSSGVTSQQMNNATVIGWDVSPERRIVQVNDLMIFLLGKFYSVMI